MAKQENVDRLRARRWFDGIIKKARGYNQPGAILIEQFILTKHKLVAASKKEPDTEYNFMYAMVQ